MSEDRQNEERSANRRAKRPSFASLGGHIAAWLAQPIGTGQAVADATGALSVDEVVALADAVRSSRVSSFSYRWSALGPVDARARVKHMDARWELAALLSLHRNGYVRQAALDVLTQERTPSALVFWMLRLDDIVPVLRTRAQNAIFERFEPQYADSFATLLPLLQRLSRRSRAGASVVLRDVMTFLVTTEAGRDALRSAYNSPSFGLRRASVALLVERADLTDSERESALGRALEDVDSALVRWAAVQITSTRTTDGVRAALLSRLDAHRDPYVRRRAVIARARESDATSYLQRALFDLRAAVRMTAREKLGGSDSRTIYRRALSERTMTRAHLRGALAGLAEVGLPEDIALVLFAMDDASPRVRAEAIRCIGMLDPAKHRQLFITHAASPSAVVRREARRALARVALE